MAIDFDTFFPVLLENEHLSNRNQQNLLKLARVIKKKAEGDRSAEEWYAYGRAQELEGDAQGAEMAYTESIFEDEQFEAAFKHRATVRLALGETDGAIEDLNQAIALDEQYLPAYIERARARSAKEDFDAAVADLELVLEREDDDEQAWFELGSVLDKAGKTEEALEKFNKAVELAPKEPYFVMHRGIAYLFTDHHEKALADFLKAQKIEGNNYVIQFNLGLAYGMLPDKSKEAYQNFERAFRKHQAALSSYIKEAQTNEKTRLVKKLDAVIENVKSIPSDAPGKFYREQLIDLLDHKLKEVR